MKRGYKQTEIGIIPEDWEVKKLGDVFGISGGFSASREQLSEHGFCYLHYGDIHGSKKTYIDTDKDFIKIPKLDIQLKYISSKSFLNDGDVVFVDASEDDDGTSRHIVVKNINNIPFISGLHTIIAKDRNGILSSLYKEYCFQASYIKKQFIFFAVGTKVKGINKTTINNILFPLPSLPEQVAIAEALSDTDELIAGLEKLIEKKKQIKKGTMQELLTGNTRLPPFGRTDTTTTTTVKTRCIASTTANTVGVMMG